MAKKGITRDRTGLMLQTLFKVFLENPEGIQAKDAIAVVAGRITLSEHEKGEYQSGGRRFDKILRFATVDAVKAGWMLKSKGLWSITDAGQDALNQYPDPGDFYREVSKLFHEWRRAQPTKAVDGLDEPDQELEAKITYEEAEEQAWQEIANYLASIDPYALQELVAALLEAMDYHVSWIAPPGKDGGVDIHAWTDPLGTKPPHIKVQVKRRKDNIAVDELRSFLALINQDDVGIFVTTGGFTRDAAELARSQESRKITLLDRDKLVELWVEYNDRLAKDKRHLLPLKPIYFLAPNE
jgi:restriction system protein